MISKSRTAGAIFCLLMALTGIAQSGDRVLNPKARILDVLFPVEVPQRPYFLKLILRFVSADTQVVVVVYPDKEKYWIRRCEVTTYTLNDNAQKQLSEILSKSSPKTSNDAVRAMAARLKLEANHFEIAPELLDDSLKELGSIRISPALAGRVSVDDYSEYELWYDNWQESVHYSIVGSPGEAPQDELVRWMVSFKTNLPNMLKKASPSKP
jgi:hypothetical protein